MNWLTEITDRIVLGYQRISNIFYCDKTGWKADSPKSRLFWKKLREEKMAKEDYDFENFVFPPFYSRTLTFWEKGEERVFKNYANFGSASFSGDASFRSASFSGAAYFQSASFSGTANFGSASFLGTANFGSASFSSTANFGSASFSNTANFDSSSFSNTANFESASFSNTAYFSSASFSNTAYFYSASFSGTANFYSASFNSNLDFQSTQFHGQVNFRRAQISFLPRTNINGFTFANAILEEAHLYGFNTLENIDFQHTTFISFNFAYKKLVNCNLTGAVITGLNTKGWQPDEATLSNTKYVYTDFEVKQEIQEGGETRKAYLPVESSRVPATGEFGAGDHEDFTIKTYLRDPIRWSHALSLPKEIRSSFVSYIRFFEDYLRTTANEEIEIRTVREGQKVRVEFMTDDLEKKAFIQEKFNHYMNDLAANPDHLTVDLSESKADEAEQQTLVADHRLQVSLLQHKLNSQAILLKEKQKNEQLLAENNQLLKNQLNFYQNAQKNPILLLEETPALPVPKPCTAAELKDYIRKDRIAKVFQELMNCSLERTQYDRLIGFQAMYERTESGNQQGKIDRQQANREDNQLRSNLLAFINALEDEGIISG